MNSEEIQDALKKAYNNNFISKEKFAEEIENYVCNTSMNYIEAIVEYCNENNIEIEKVNKLIPKVLKEKIRADALKLNYLHRSSRASELKFQ